MNEKSNFGRQETLSRGGGKEVFEIQKKLHCSIHAQPCVNIPRFYSSSLDLPDSFVVKSLGPGEEFESDMEDISVNISASKVSSHDCRGLNSEPKLQRFFAKHNSLPQMELTVTGNRKQVHEVEISRFDPNGLGYSFTRNSINILRDFKVHFNLSPFVKHQSGQLCVEPSYRMEYAYFSEGSLAPRYHGELWGKNALPDVDTMEHCIFPVWEDEKNNVFIEFLDYRFMCKKSLTLEKYIVWDFVEVEDEIKKLFLSMGYRGDLDIDFGKKRHLISVERTDGWLGPQSSLFLYILSMVFVVVMFPITLPLYLYFKFVANRRQDIHIYSDFVIDCDWQQFMQAVTPSLRHAYYRAASQC